MTRFYLAASVAALALVAPVTAAPGGHGGGMQMQRVDRPQRAQRVAPTERVQAARTQRADRAIQREERVAAMQAQRQERAAARPTRVERVDHAQTQRMERVQAVQQQRADRMQQVQAQRAERVQAAQQQRADRIQQVQAQRAERMQQVQAQRANRMQQVQTMQAQRLQQAQANAVPVTNAQGNRGVGYGVGGCPPGLATKGCMPPGLAAQQGLTTLRANRVAAAQSRLAQQSALALQRLDNNVALAPVPMALTAAGTTIMPVGQAVQYVGQPLSALSTLGLTPVPSSLSYLYPTTPQYYYQYGNGYMYQVDRTSNLISALLPLLGGGYMPGQYLPSSYMGSYVPDYYGLNSFYPTAYGSNYYGYDNLCNRYANGVVYQVDCMTGLVENVVPLYASGYGVGQMIPSSYDYYNLPYQYRSMYPASSDMGYWYAPGAIYQYDPSSSLITSVAALLSPGLTVGQPLPMGYNTYNVPYAYRSQYVDTADAWYRYNNGYIYQVDPTTQLVSAIVASVLT